METMKTMLLYVLGFCWGMAIAMAFIATNLARMP